MGADLNLHILKQITLIIIKRQGHNKQEQEFLTFVSYFEQL